MSHCFFAQVENANKRTELQKRRVETEKKRVETEKKRSAVEIQKNIVLQMEIESLKRQLNPG